MGQVDTISPPAGRADSPVRTLLLKFGFALFFMTLGLKLVQIQLIDSPKYKALARKQYEQKFILPATRGNILDRNGNVLVSNTMFVSFAADPTIVGDNADAVAGAFARAFGKPKSFYLDRLRDTSKRFVWLERGVAPSLAKRLEANELDGIVTLNEPKRLYHYDDLAGTLIGFTDVDNKGISGLEFAMDDALRGRSGSVVMQRDGLGRVRPSVDYPRVEPVDGEDVVLTLDVSLQAVVEEELRRGLAANKAESGLAVVVNPRSGEILALSVIPGLNPRKPVQANDPTARNRVVGDLFEPGSVFKIVTASAALENNLSTLATRYYAEHGVMKVPLGGRRVRVIRDTHPMDWISFEEAMEFSSNIVMAKVGKEIGAERFYREARDFGFGVFSGVDIPGEARGKLKRPAEWSKTTLQAMSYGYEVGVTPLQIACAYAAAANGGFLMKPYIVAAVHDPDGRTLTEGRAEPIRRVISAETANHLTEAFEGTVERGTAKEAMIRGIRIAGKTGTSRKLLNGQYSTSNYTALFVGYFPAENPQIVCLVMMDNPHARGYYGGETSAPVFRAIAERIINSSSRFETDTKEAESTTTPSPLVVPDVRSLRPTLAEEILTGEGLTVQFFGRGELVLRQSPEPGKKVDHGETVSLILSESNATRDGLAVVPDVRGMSLRRALNRLCVDDFSVSIRGSGVVTGQNPAPGLRVQPGSGVILSCGIRGLDQTTLY